MTLTQHTPYLLSLIEAERRAVEEASTLVQQLAYRVRATELTLFGLAFDNGPNDPRHVMFSEAQDQLESALPMWTSILSRRASKLDIMDAQLLEWSIAHDINESRDPSQATNLVEGLFGAAELKTTSDRHTALQLICDVLSSHVTSDKLDDALQDLGYHLQVHLSCAQDEGDEDHGTEGGSFERDSSVPNAHLH